MSGFRFLIDIAHCVKLTFLDEWLSLLDEWLSLPTLIPRRCRLFSRRLFSRRLFSLRLFSRRLSALGLVRTPALGLVRTLSRPLCDGDAYDDRL